MIPLNPLAQAQIEAVVQRYKKVILGLVTQEVVNALKEAMPKLLAELEFGPQPQAPSGKKFTHCACGNFAGKSGVCRYCMQ